MLAHPAALPSLPRAVALLMTDLVHDEHSLCRANQLMGNDPALTAHRVRFAAPRWTTTPTSRWREDSSGIVVRPCPQGPSGRRGNGRFFPWDWTSIWCSSKTPSIGRLGPRHPTTWFEKLRTYPPCLLLPQKRTRLGWLLIRHEST